VHRTAGTLRVLGLFSELRQFLVTERLSPQPPVTQAVGPFKGVIVGTKDYQHEFQVLSDGVLSFNIRDGANQPWWWYLDIHGQPLYLIGNMCGTCSAIFSRVSRGDLPLTPRELATQLEVGLATITPDAIDTVAALLPKGSYKVGFVTVKPTLTYPQTLPHEVACEADNCGYVRLRARRMGPTTNWFCR
jgi:hypothetical protein